MDARLDTLSTELYQVNVCVGRIAWQQAAMGGFAPEPTPSPPDPVASDSDVEDDDSDDNDASDDDWDASSIDEISTWHSNLCYSWKKGGVVLDMRVVTFRGELVLRIIVLGGVLLFFLRDVVRMLCIFSFLSFLDTLFLYMRSWDHL